MSSHELLETALRVLVACISGQAPASADEETLRSLGKPAIKEMLPQQIGEISITYADISKVKNCLAFPQKPL